MNYADNILLQQSPYLEDEGHYIGRTPDTISAEEWRQAGIAHQTTMAAIRSKCLDCVHTPTEVRKCVQTSCPLWPLRMGKYAKNLISPNKGKIIS